ncbi:MAG: hypothetical protein ACT4OE_06290 [Sphingosinicella sp.]
MELQPAPKNRALFWALVAATILYLVALPFSTMMVMMMPMASDSGLDWRVWLFTEAALTFPVALVLCPVLGWVAYAKRWNRTGWIVVALPLLWPLILVATVFL